jgi:hypothetical protein
MHYELRDISYELMIVRYRCCTLRSSARFLSSFYTGRILHDFVNSPDNLTVVKTLEAVLTSLAVVPVLT